MRLLIALLLWCGWVQAANLEVVITGLPPGVEAEVYLEGESLEEAVPLAQSQRLTDLEPGRYWLLVGRAVADGVSYLPSFEQLELEIRAGELRLVQLVYAPLPGSLLVEVNGLPAQIVPQLSLTGTGLAGPVLLGGNTRVGPLVPGRYALEAAPLQVDGVAYSAELPRQELGVTSGTQALLRVNYRPTLGSVKVEIAGLSGWPGGLRLEGARSYAVDSAELGNLEAGQYRLVAQPVEVEGKRLYPWPPSQIVKVQSGQPTPVRLLYLAQTGSVRVDTAGLPPGIQPVLQLEVKGQAWELGAGPAWVGLPPGEYLLRAAPLEGGYMAVQTEQTVKVGDGQERVVRLEYAMPGSALQLRILGLPQGERADLVLQAPDGSRRSLRLGANSTLNGVKPGNYRLTAGSVSVQGDPYDPQVAEREVEVLAGRNAVVEVVYALSPGKVILAATGLPPGVAGIVQLLPLDVEQAEPITLSFEGRQTFIVPAGNYEIVTPYVYRGRTAYGTRSPESNLSLSPRAQLLLALEYLPLPLAELTVNLIDPAEARVVLEGPQGTRLEWVLRGAETLIDLLPGSYRVRNPEDTPEGTGIIPREFTVLAFEENSVDLELAAVEQPTGGPDLSRAELEFLGTVSPDCGVVYTVAAHPQRPILVLACENGQIIVWDWDAEEELARLRGHRNLVTSLAFSPDGNLLASASKDQTVRLWDFKAQRALAVLEGHAELVWTVAFSPDGQWLASGGEDQTVKVWNPRNRELVATWRGPASDVYTLAFDPSSRFVLVGHQNGDVVQWSLANGEPVTTLKPGCKAIGDLVFDPAGKYLAAGCADGRVALWDWSTRKIAGFLEGHDDFVYAVAFHPQGGLLASGAEDGTVRVWAMDSLSEIAVLDEPGDEVTGVVFLANGQGLAAGGFSEELYLWSLGGE
jgi:WD40 repeat protein